MIKLFRRIRYDLMETGKTAKYLKYAIGEIVLVVIGILIAVQINQWQNSIYNSKQEQFYLEKLVQNISQDTAYIKQRIQGINTGVNSLKELKDELHSPVYKEFTKDSMATKLVGVYKFSPQKSTMDNLISTGKLEVLQNQTLVDSLFVYYNDLNNFPLQRTTSDETYSRITFGPKLLQMPGGIFNLKKSRLTSADSIFISNSIEMKLLNIEGLKDDYIFSYERAKRIISLLKNEIK